MSVTTETIMYLLANILRIYSCKKILTSFLPNERKVPKYLEFVGYIAFYALNSYIYLGLNQPVLNILTNIVPLFCLCFCRQTRIVPNLLASALTFVATMLSEAVLCVLFNVSIVFSSGIASGFVLFLIALMTEHIYKNRTMNKINIPLLIGIIVLPAGSIVISALTISEYSITSVTVAAILVLINIVAFYLYGALSDMHEERQKNLLILHQNQTYNEQLKIVTQANEHLSYFRHDMKNHFLQIQSFVQNQQYQELEKYVTRSIGSLDTNARFVTTNNPQIDCVINCKLSEAKQNNAEITTDIQLPEGLQIDCFDWNIILGNLLDNAIEALRLCEKKKLSLSIYYECGTLCLRIENTCSNEPYIVNGELASTKRMNHELHGIGLRSVQNILQKYHGEIEFSCENQVFTVCILMYL